MEWTFNDDRNCTRMATKKNGKEKEVIEEIPFSFHSPFIEIGNEE